MNWKNDNPEEKVLDYYKIIRILVITLMKDELTRKIMTEFTTLRPKRYTI